MTCQPRQQHRRRQTCGQHQRHRRPSHRRRRQHPVFTVSQSNLSTLDTVVDVTLGASSNISAATFASISYTNAAGNVVTLTTSARDSSILEQWCQRQDCSGSTVAPVITVTVADDAIYEQSEDLVLDISNPVNATIGNNSATGVILDESDDPANPGSKHRRRQTCGQRLLTPWQRRQAASSTPSPYQTPPASPSATRLA